MKLATVMAVCVYRSNLPEFIGGWNVMGPKRPLTPIDFSCIWKPPIAVACVARNTSLSRSLENPAPESHD